MKKILTFLGVVVFFVFLAILMLPVLKPQPASAQTKTVEVIKVSTSLVSSNGDGQGKYSITLQCALNVDASPEYTFSVTQDYMMGSSVADVYQQFEDVMQERIDKYVAEQAVYNHAQLDVLIGTLGSNLSW